MAFGFGDLLNIVELGVGIFGAVKGFEGQEEPPANQQLTALAEQQAELAQILLNPNDPRFKELVGEFDAMNRRELIEALNFLRIEASQPNARLLNPERRDEAIAQTTAREFQRSKEFSRQQARNFISGAANINASALSGFSAAVPAQTATINTNTTDFFSALDASTSLARDLAGILQPTPIVPTAQLQQSLGASSGPPGFPINRNQFPQRVG